MKTLHEGIRNTLDSLNKLDEAKRFKPERPNPTKILLNKYGYFYSGDHTAYDANGKCVGEYNPGDISGNVKRKNVEWVGTNFSSKNGNSYDIHGGEWRQSGTKRKGPITDLEAELERAEKEDGYEKTFA